MSFHYCLKKGLHSVPSRDQGSPFGEVAGRMPMVRKRRAPSLECIRGAVTNGSRLLDAWVDDLSGESFGSSEVLFLSSSESRRTVGDSGHSSVQVGCPRGAINRPQNERGHVRERQNAHQLDGAFAVLKASRCKATKSCTDIGGLPVSSVMILSSPEKMPFR